MENDFLVQVVIQDTQTSTTSHYKYFSNKNPVLKSNANFKRAFEGQSRDIKDWNDYKYAISKFFTSFTKYNAIHSFRDNNTDKYSIRLLEILSWPL